MKTNPEYTLLMLAKLLDALRRRGTAQDGNWGFPSFHEEIEEMHKSILDTPEVKKYIHESGLTFRI